MSQSVASRRGRYLIAAVVCVLATVLPATRASAADPVGAYNALFPSQVSGCTSSTQIGATVSIYSTAGRYYGWAEQRYSSNGACRGYQWIRLHVTYPIPVVYSEGLSHFVRTFIVDDAAGGRQISTTLVAWRMGVDKYGISFWVLPAVTYDTRIMYAPHDPLCGYIYAYPDVADGTRSDLFFGHAGKQYSFCTT
jgi:hypothetical protein